MPKTKNIINKIFNDDSLRRELTKKSHFWFFNIYLADRVKYKTAPFQKEIFKLTENEKIKNLTIMAFRGSAKSTIMTLSYPIWAILGKQQKKFVLILSQTQSQAKQHMYNLKSELEKNDILRKDLGPFEEQDGEWRASSLVLPKYKARITTASVDQSIRGILHKEHRPDLIICDDIEDLSSVKNREGRDKTYEWLTGDVIPAGDKNTKLVLIGTLLHEDSVLMRFKKKIENGKLDGVWKKYPLIDNKNNIAWPGKFPKKEDIQTLKKSVGNDISWHREYLLKIISNIDQVVRPEWIHYYDTLPDLNREDEEIRYRHSATAIDLAISKKDTADFTAMVSARIYNWGDKMKIYILPNPINERLSFPETVKKAKEISKAIGNGMPTILYIEKVGCQEALTQRLIEENYKAIGIPIKGDKRARLSLTTPAIQSGTVLFPRKGAERLIEQLVGFATERYDDLADSFSMLIGKEIADNEYRSPFPIQREAEDDDYGRPITRGFRDMEF